MNRNGASGSLLGGSALVAGLAVVFWALATLFDSACRTCPQLEGASSGGFVLLALLVTLYQLVEGPAQRLGAQVRRLVRLSTAARLSRNAFPDALAEPDPRPAEWSSPQECHRCGTVRPSAVPCCPRCCSPWW